MPIKLLSISHPNTKSTRFHIYSNLFGYFNLQILAAVLIVITVVAYMDASVQSSRQLSKAKKLAGNRKNKQ